MIKIFKNKWEDEKNDQKLKSIKNFKLKKITKIKEHIDQLIKKWEVNLKHLD